MLTVRRASERGRSQTDWLDSRHTFSFADYVDPKHMGFGPLRVINEDIVAPGRGFGRHPHRDMEILSYVLEGALQHADSMGTGSIIRPGDVQRMSAGTGVLHSERNQSPSEPVHFMQIWIEPEQQGLAPGYEQKRFDDRKRNALRLIASKDGRDGSVTVHQDASLYVGAIDPGATVKLDLVAGRRAWLQVLAGDVVVNGQSLARGDGGAAEGESSLTIAGGREPSEVLLFDLA
ncbi:MAG TPA: pirin family protein [Polyangiaceae bacterium]|jgi:redox-sensitive bicupin YhaK (pirin superfamily)|nr:pirin family protein [Polyangiaceae bacterium]